MTLEIGRSILEQEGHPLWRDHAKRNLKRRRREWCAGIKKALQINRRAFFSTNPYAGDRALLIVITRAAGPKQSNEGQASLLRFARNDNGHN